MTPPSDLANFERPQRGQPKKEQEVSDDRPD
jgi:hypothetical protein